MPRCVACDNSQGIGQHTLLKQHFFLICGWGGRKMIRKSGPEYGPPGGATKKEQTVSSILVALFSGPEDGLEFGVAFWPGGLLFLGT